MELMIHVHVLSGDEHHYVLVQRANQERLTCTNGQSRGTKHALSVFVIVRKVQSLMPSHVHFSIVQYGAANRKNVSNPHVAPCV